MKVTVRVQTTRKGDAGKWLADFEKRMKGPAAVKVGFPSGKSPADVVQIAVWNHFGTRGSGQNFVTKGIGGKMFGGFGGPIPPRPFITLALFKHRGEIRHNLRALYRSILTGKTDARVGLERLAMYGVGIIDKTIAGGVGPKNAPLTIAIKGSSTPLIASGRMRQSLTWAFDGGGHGPAGRGPRRMKTASPRPISRK